MSQPYNYYVGNGVQTAFEFTQELNLKATVIGLVNYAVASGSYDTGTGFFTFDTAPASGADVHVMRSTDQSVMAAAFPNKSYISSDNLDANNRQLINFGEETYWYASQVLPQVDAAAASAAAAAATLANAVTKDGLTPMDSAADLTFSGGGEPTGLPATPGATGASSKEYTNAQDALKVDLAGDTMTGNLTISYTGGGSTYPTLTITDEGHALGGSSLSQWSANGFIGVGAVGETAANYGDGYIEWDLNGLLGNKDLPYAAIGLRTKADATIHNTYIMPDGTIRTLYAEVADISADGKNLTTREYVDTAFSNPNAMVNGNFDVWQRGTSFPSVASTAFTADRWAYLKSGAMVHTISESSDVPTYAQSGMLSNSSFLLDCTTADASIAAAEFCILRYKVEGYDYARIGGGDITLSFWVKATKTGTYTVSFSDGTSSYSYNAEYTVTTTDTWEKVSVTIPADESVGTWNHTNSLGITLDFVIAAGTAWHGTADTWVAGLKVGTANQVNGCDNTANNFRISQVKLEKGSVATPMEPVDHQTELAKCFRYYERISISERFTSSAAGEWHNNHVTHAPKRAQATVGLVTAGGRTNVTSATLITSSGAYPWQTARFEVVATAAATPTYALGDLWELKAEL